MIRPVDVISSNLFTYNKETKTFSSEASTLKGFNLTKPTHSDCLNEGFGIRSEKTGKVEVFVNPIPTFDDEGDVMYWTFAAFNLDLFFKKIKVVIFND